VNSPNVIRVIRPRRLRGAGHVARLGNKSDAYRVLVGKREGGSHVEDPGIDGRIILKWILENWDGEHALS
jgi:hypothetical protein